jgi:type VI secretion system secreted protein VgrG
MRLPNSLVRVYDEAFTLKDPQGQPLNHIPFKVTASDGAQKGATSAEGAATRVSTTAIEELKFELRWFNLHK